MNISIIVNIWKRNSLEEILTRINNQTIASNINEIIVWQNESHIDISNLKEKFQFTHIHSTNKNWKFHARFTLPLLINSEYSVILDDDTLPNKKYLEECVRLSNQYNDKIIICGNGRDILNKSNPNNQKGYESATQSYPIEVDFGGHSWFFKTEIIKWLWQNHSRLFISGEDIEFCASSKIFGGIKTITLGSTDTDCMADSDRHKFGTIHASSYENENLHRSARHEMIQYWLTKGWKLKID